MIPLVSYIIASPASCCPYMSMLQPQFFLGIKIMKTQVKQSKLASLVRVGKMYAFSWLVRNPIVTLINVSSALVVDLNYTTCFWVPFFFPSLNPILLYSVHPTPSTSHPQLIFFNLRRIPPVPCVSSLSHFICYFRYQSRAMAKSFVRVMYRISCPFSLTCSYVGWHPFLSGKRE